MVTCTTIGDCSSLPSGFICVPIANKVSEDVTLTYQSKDKTPCFKPFTVIKGSSKSYGLPPNSVWKVSGKSKNYDALLIPSTTPSSPLLILDTVEDRSMLKTYKKFPFWPLIAAWVVVIIVGFALMAGVAKATVTQECAEKGFDETECSTEVSLGSVKPLHKGLFIFGLVVSFLILIFLVVGFIFVKGPAKYSVDYNTCSGRPSFGEGGTWRWTEPTSLFKRVLCRAFGGCECSSDVLHNNCIYSAAKSGSPFVWDSKAAMLNTDNNNANCYCCDGNNCVVGKATCKKNDNKNK